MNNKQKFIFTNAIIQTVFALAFMCNRNPELHWCAVAPIVACGVLLILYYDDKKE